MSKNDLTYKISPPSPCVGLCSTTYGDQICRGCTRFMHEIISWNQYTPAEKNATWHRLEQFITQVLSDKLIVIDKEQLKNFLLKKNIRFTETLNEYSLAWEFIRYHTKNRQTASHLLEALDYLLIISAEHQKVSVSSFFHTTQEDLIHLAEAYHARYIIPAGYT